MVFTKDFLQATETSHPCFFRKNAAEQSFKGSLRKVRDLVLGDSSPRPTCFISYAGDPSSYAWSSQLTSFLETAGINTVFDLSDLQIADDITQFINQIRDVDFVIVLFTPLYKQNYSLQKWIRDEGELIKQRLGNRSAEDLKFFIPIVAGNATESIPPDFFGNDPKYIRNILHYPLATVDEKDIALFSDCIFRFLGEKFFKEIIGTRGPQRKKFEIIQKEFNRIWEEYLKKRKHHLTSASPVVSEGIPNPVELFESYPTKSEESYSTLIHLELFKSRQKHPLGLGTLALEGEGGTGKTFLALDYAQRARGCNAYDVIGWVRGETPESFRIDCRNLLVQMKEEIFSTSAPEEFRKAFDRAFSGKKWLVVCDNCDEALFPDLLSIIPQEAGDIVVTTRSANVWKALGYRNITITGFQPSEGVNYLFRRKTEEERTFAAERSARRIVQVLLDGLPLAIAQAESLMHEKHWTVGHYEETFQDNAQNLLGYVEEWKKYGTPSRMLTHPNILVTWAMSEQAVQERLPGIAKNLLDAFCYSPPDRIPLSPLEKLAGGSRDALESALNILQRYRLITISGYNEAQEASMHRLFQQVCRLKREEGGEERVDEVSSRRYNLREGFEKLWESWKTFLSQNAFQGTPKRALEISKMYDLHRTLSLLLPQMDYIKQHIKRLPGKRAALRTHYEVKNSAEQMKIKTAKVLLRVGTAEEIINYPRLLQEELGISPQQYQERDAEISSLTPFLSWEDLFEMHRVFHEMYKIGTEEEKEARDLTIQQAQLLSHKAITGSKMADLLESVYFLEENSRQRLCQRAQEVLEQVPGNPAFAVQVASLIPEEAQVQVFSTLDPLLQEKKLSGLQNYQMILKGIASLDKTNLPSVIDRAKDFIPEEMEVEELVLMLHAIAKISDDVLWGKIKDTLMIGMFTPPNENKKEIHSFLQLISLLPDNHLEESSVLAWTYTLQARKIPGVNPLIHHMAAQISFVDCSRFLDVIKPLSVQEEFPSENSCILHQLMAELPFTRYIPAGFALWNIFNKKGEGWRAKLVTLAIKELSKEKLEKIKDSQSSTTGRRILSQIIEAAKIIPMNAMENLERKTIPFFKEEYDTRMGEAATILKFVHEHFPDELPDLQAKLDRLLEKAEPFLGATKDGIGAVLSTIEAIPDDQWDTVMATAEPFLFREGKALADGNSTAQILTRAWEKPEDLEKAKILFRPGMTCSSIDAILQIINRRDLEAPSLLKEDRVDPINEGGTQVKDTLRPRKKGSKKVRPQKGEYSVMMRDNRTCPRERPHPLFCPTPPTLASAYPFGQRALPSPFLPTSFSQHAPEVSYVSPLAGQIALGAVSAYMLWKIGGYIVTHINSWRQPHLSQQVEIPEKS